MHLEVVNSVAAIGTFAVIGAPAIVALVLLESFSFVWHELPSRLDYPEFRYDLASGAPPDRIVHKALRAADYYERLGSMLKHGLFPEDLYFDNNTPELTWENIEPVVALMRRKRGPSVYENFEYLVARSRAGMSAIRKARIQAARRAWRYGTHGPPLTPVPNSFA